MEIIELTVSDRGLCVITLSFSLLCWDFFDTINNITNLKINGINKISSVSMGTYSVCVIEDLGSLLCSKSGVGQVNTVIPQGLFEKETIDVRTSMHANIAVDQNGALRFWWNEPRYSQPLKILDKSYYE